MYGRRPYSLLLGGDKMRERNTKKLTLSALLGTLSLGSLWGSSSLGTGTLAFLGIAVCLSSVVFYECGNKYGLLHYGAVSLLSLLLFPKGVPVLAYVAFLGYYPIIREKIKHIGVRAIIFSAIYIISFLLFKNLLLEGFVPQFKHYLIWLLGGEIVFLIFDYAIMCFNIFYKEKFSFLKK